MTIWSSRSRSQHNRSWQCFFFFSCIYKRDWLRQENGAHHNRLSIILSTFVSMNLLFVPLLFGLVFIITDTSFYLLQYVHLFSLCLHYCVVTVVKVLFLFLSIQRAKLISPLSNCTYFFYWFSYMRYRSLIIVINFLFSRSASFCCQGYGRSEVPSNVEIGFIIFLLQNIFS